MSEYVYRYPITIDLGKAVSEVGELIDSLNAGLSTCGVSDRIKCQTEIGCSVITVGRALTEEEVETMRTALERGLREDALPEFDLRVGTPCCKSGNSSSQSTAT